MNEVRIIAGQFRGRRLHFRPTGGLRPTLDAVRETLFNWLMFKIKDAQCLDAFAGSGALGFEALSRFAGFITFLEHDKETVITLKKNLKLFGVQDHARILHDSSLHFLAKAEVTPFDLIFLDPPFGSNLLAQSLKLISERSWLTAGGFIYVEAERQMDIAALLECQFSFYRHKFLGEVQFGLLELLG